MSLTRKVLRFGKPLPLIKAIMDRFKQHQKSPVRNIVLRTLSDISLALYFISDHPLYFQRIGFIKMDKATVDFIDYWNNIYWLFECLVDIYCDLVDVHYLDKEIGQLKASLKGESSGGQAETKAKIKELSLKKFALILNIIRSSVDVPVIFHFMGSPRFSSGLAGFCGTISSSISLYNLWGK